MKRIDKLRVFISHMGPEGDRFINDSYYSEWDKHLYIWMYNNNGNVFRLDGDYYRLEYIKYNFNNDTGDYMKVKRTSIVNV